MINSRGCPRDYYARNYDDLTIHSMANKARTERVTTAAEFAPREPVTACVHADYEFCAYALCKIRHEAALTMTTAAVRATPVINVSLTRRQDNRVITEDRRRRTRGNATFSAKITNINSYPHYRKNNKHKFLSSLSSFAADNVVAGVENASDSLEVF